MSSESKRLARLIPSDTLEAVSNLSFPNPGIHLSAYLGSLRCLSGGASASRFRDASTTFPFRNAHFRLFSSRAGFQFRGVRNSLPVPGYLSGPSCRGFEPLCQGLVDHPLYFVFESPLSTFAGVNHFRVASRLLRRLRQHPVGIGRSRYFHIPSDVSWIRRFIHIRQTLGPAFHVSLVPGSTTGLSRPEP